MLKNILLKGNVLWAYDSELENKSQMNRFAGLFSFVKPLHQHKGEIILTDNQIVISGDYPVSISLASIDQLFLGFDEFYSVGSVKNWGVFWQPLRIKFSDLTPRKIYLVIGYNGISAQNKLWYDTLKEMLSQR